MGRNHDQAKASSKVRVGALALTGLIAAISARLTYADTAASDASATHGDGLESLEEIIVTADKRTESLMEAPETVAVVSGAQLEQGHEVQLRDYLSLIPGVSIQDGGYGQTAISIRGLATSSYLAPTVGMEVDGIPVGSSTAIADSELRPDLDPSGIANIQVLYGPQGTLYGDDAMGGLIEFTTTKPDLNQFSGRVQLDGSNVDHGGWGSSERVGVNIPIIEGTLAVSLNAFDRKDPGFIYDVQTGVHNVNDGTNYGGRFDLLWQISDKASLRLNALAQNSSYNGDATSDVTQNYAPVYGDYANIGYAGLNWNREKYRFYTGTFDIDFGWAHLLSLTGYNDTYFATNLDITNDLAPDFGTPPNDIYSILQIDETKKISQELRLTSPAEQKLEWIAGLYYTHESTYFAQNLFAFDDLTGGPPAASYGLGDGVLQEPVLNPSTIFYEYAGYVTLTYHFTPEFDLEAGGRYAHETTDFPASTSIGVLAGGPTIAATETDDPTTFLVSARYHFSKDQMVYLRVASGFRPGGSNVAGGNGYLPGVPPTYAPDKTTDYEIGYKGTLLGGRLALLPSLYYITWSDVQIGVLNEYYQTFTENGSKAKSEGAQLAAQYQFGYGLSAELDVNYTDAAIIGNGPPGSGVSPDAPLPFNAKWSGSLNITDKFPITPRWKGSAQAIYHYFGDRYGEFNSVTPGSALEPQVALPGYSTVDILGGVSDDRYSLNFFARNVTDKRAFSNAQDQGTGFLEVRLVTPRVIGLSAAVKF
jgi:iron complex outermembrane receptor protein